MKINNYFKSQLNNKLQIRLIMNQLLIYLKIQIQK
jgi:hypothetical protein